MENHDVPRGDVGVIERKFESVRKREKWFGYKASSITIEISSSLLITLS